MSSWRKWKGNGHENVCLYSEEISQPILQSLCQECIKFDHFGNKYKNNAFFEVIQTSELSIKQTSLK